MKFDENFWAIYWQPSHVFPQKQVFGPRTAKSHPIWIKFLHTPIVVRNTLVSRLRPRSARGRLQAKPERFVILVTHAKSYIETMDRCGLSGKPSKWRWGRVLSWKIPEFCSVGGARSKTAFFAFLDPLTILSTAYRNQFYPKPMVPMESRD